MDMQEELKNNFISFCLKYSQDYLELGGPTSRLERKIIELGAVYDLPVEIFSTASVVLLSIPDSKQALSKTAMKRLTEDQINLNQLRALNTLMNQMIAKEVSFIEGEDSIDEIKRNRDIYPISLRTVSSFLVGFFSSYSQYGNLTWSVLAGGFTLLVTSVFLPLFLKFNFTRIYFSFFSLTATIMLSALIGMYLGISPEPILIGALIPLLPGLRLTNSVSELADHNFVSGTVKLAKSILMLVALGTSFVISQEILESMVGQEIVFTLDSNAQAVPYILEILSTAGMIVCFAITFYVPPRAIFLSLVAGMTGWLSITMLNQYFGIYLSAFLSTAVVGFISLSFSRIFKVPSQVYSVPGIISLVPGLFSLTVVYRASSKFQETHASTTVFVSLLVSSLVFGLVTARIPFQAGQNSGPADD